MEKITSLFGVIVLILLAWAFSTHRNRFPWRIAAWALGLQLLFAVLILKTGIGQKLFSFAQQLVLKLNEFARVGASMVFGPLADEDLMAEAFGPQNTLIFAISVASIIILVSSLSSLLYHWGMLQKAVRGVSWCMQRMFKTSGSETLATAANIFVGQTEAPLLIKPYLSRMTQSELMVLMTGGMATIAGNMLVVYASLGEQAGFPHMAGHLMSASLISAPATLMMAKILNPETEISETGSGNIEDPENRTRNGIDAICTGATEGMHLSMNVLAMLIAFVAIVALINWLLGGFLWVVLGIDHASPLQTVFGWINAPFAWLMGVPWQDCLTVGGLLGERIVLNEFVGYLHLTEGREQMQERSFVLATYALCGFANFGSVAIQIGGIGSLAPERRHDLAKLGLRAMLGGLLTCYLTATVVGLLL